MLGIIAGVIFAVAFVLSAVSFHSTNALTNPITLIALGLSFLAFQCAGVGPAWTWGRSPRA